MSVVGLVGNGCVRGGILGQRIRTSEVMSMSGREQKACRVTQCIDCGVNRGAQPASISFKGLLIRIPPFAPALCLLATTHFADRINRNILHRLLMNMTS